MADDSTTGIRGMTGTSGSLNDRKGDPTVPAASVCHLVHEEQIGEVHFSRDNVERLLAGGSFFWIDLLRPQEEDFAVLREVFRFHPLAVEDSEHFGQRAKLEDYDDFVFLVVYGAVPDEDRLVEVHCFYSDRFLITVHRDEAPAFTEVRRRYQKRRLPIDDPVLLLHRIIDALVDSFFPILADFDDRIDELENQTFARERGAAAGDFRDEAAARRHEKGGNAPAGSVCESCEWWRRTAEDDKGGRAPVP